MDGDQDYSCLPLPGLHEHFGQVLSYEKVTAGTAAIEEECAMDPALAELRQHLLRHHITFCVFDSKCQQVLHQMDVWFLYIDPAV